MNFKVIGFLKVFQRIAPRAMIGDLIWDFYCNAAKIGNLSTFYFYAYICLRVPVRVMADCWGPWSLMTFAVFMRSRGGGMPYMMLVCNIGRLNAAGPVPLLLLGWAIAAPGIG